MSIIISALRGPLTAGEIAGCPVVPFGDPGLFVREIWPGPDALNRTNKIGIVPHHSMLNHPALEKIAQAFDGVVILDFTDPDIAATLSRLASCSRIISSSLHGLIFADAYGIPSLFWREGDTFSAWKYQDYFDGVSRDDFCHLSSSEILEAVTAGGAESLPFSQLSEGRCLSVLDDLRAAINAMP
ncbi:MAG: polysaccharide pyruvyl transferase family protein [Paracoccus sp. (in: a-proteobacteria)]|nr:polysaccharide pyruvyl transferase family protein [Paracoccus sp. (in: a-proteobacteria)]